MYRVWPVFHHQWEHAQVGAVSLAPASAWHPEGPCQPLEDLPRGPDSSRICALQPSWGCLYLPMCTMSRASEDLGWVGGPSGLFCARWDPHSLKSLFPCACHMLHHETSIQAFSKL